jgi:hypothetical protein
VIEYAKAAPDDIFIRITATNQGPVAAPLHLLPTLWFRNIWSWGDAAVQRPEMHLHTDHLIHPPGAQGDSGRLPYIAANHAGLGAYHLYPFGAYTPLFTENETNVQRLFGVANPTPHVKDAFHTTIVDEQDCANPDRFGTKAAAHYHKTLAPGEVWTVELRLCRDPGEPLADPHGPLEATFADRIREADAFYAAIQPASLSADLARIQRQAFAGMLWSKQFYHYDVARWLDGDPNQPPPPYTRKFGRNSGWETLNNADVISMPDTWEYPWYAAWDLAFHCLPLAIVDSEFAKNQLILILREWYLHPNGQVPAYEWTFSDVNPPVLAWAAWRVYKIDQRQRGKGDTAFIERVFHKLLLNFTWWVNRKDTEGRNVFQGGFLGLDNIGVFDRSAPLPTGGHIEQSDGTSWMAMFSLNMLTIALELARTNPVYEDIATKFFEHFMFIAGAMNNIGNVGFSLWDDEDEFFYDVLHIPEQTPIPLRVRSLVGLIPLLAVETIEPDMLARLPGFKARLEWFLGYRPDLARLVSRWQEPGLGERRLLALVRGHRFKRLLRRALDEAEFLSPYGIRSVSKYHADHPYVFDVDGNKHSVAYEPAESRSGLFGGNSNWRGPVWFPINYLLIEALQKFHHYYGDDFKVESPTGSGEFHTINEIANDLSRRLIQLFTPGEGQKRPFNGQDVRLQHDPLWRDYILFYEYFHGDTGAGLGASHQTGWTGLVAKLIQQQGEHEELNDL